MFIKLVQDDIGIGISSKLNADAHSFPAGMVVDICNAVDLFITHKRCDRLDQTCFIYHIRKFCHNNLRFSVRKRLDIGHRTDAHFSPSGTVRFVDAAGSENLRAGWKIRTFDDLQNLIQLRFTVFFNDIVDDLYDRADNLPQIVRGNVRRHTYRDSGSTVDQQVWITRRHYHRLFLRLIEVRCEINSILVQIGDHLHGDLAQTSLRITHRRRPITVHGTEVSMTVYQGITGRPVLRHIDQGAVNRTVSMRVIFTHRITDNTRTLTMRFVRRVIQFDH